VREDVAAVLVGRSSSYIMMQLSARRRRKGEGLCAIVGFWMRSWRKGVKGGSYICGGRVGQRFFTVFMVALDTKL
jgi:hypothetical protein